MAVSLSRESPLGYSGPTKFGENRDGGQVQQGRLVLLDQSAAERKAGAALPHSEGAAEV
jgi:hypothetical protein